MRAVAVQRHMPRRRAGHTTAVTLGGERFYITANAREDSTLGEVFIQWGKQGSSSAGLLDIYAIGWSVALQHGVPLTDLIRCNLDLYFVPGEKHRGLHRPPPRDRLAASSRTRQARNQDHPGKGRRGQRVDHPNRDARPSGGRPREGGGRPGPAP